MHQTSYDLMGLLLGDLGSVMKKLPIDVLDCGSAIANTGMQVSYRDHVEKLGWRYKGMDVTPGKNVDAVIDIYKLCGITTTFQQFDVIISGQMLEHLTFPLLAAQEMKACVRPGGWVIWIAPWQYGIHRYPIDCWRICPDGMAFLLEGFENIKVGRSGNDCYGMAQKPENYKQPWEIKRA